MKNYLYIDELKSTFNKEPFTHNQLYQFYAKKKPGLNKNTFRWYIHTLKKERVFYSVKRGLYLMGNKDYFMPEIQQALKTLYMKIKNQFPYSQISIWDTKWLANYMVHQPLTNNTIVEVDKEAMFAVFRFLQETTSDVYLKPDKHEIENYIVSGKSNIIVKNLIVDSPTTTIEDMTIPKAEKIIVDLFADTEIFSPYQGSELANILTALFDRYIINQSTLNRYAKIRNVKEKIVEFINNQTSLDRKNVLS